MVSPAARAIMRRLPTPAKLGFNLIAGLLLVLFLTGIAAAPLHAEKWQDLKVQGYINDFAGVLNPTTVERITRLCTEVDQKAKAQIAVVTIKSLDGDAVEDFANHLFQKWGVGYKGTDRGVMVLLAVEDHKYWTEVGYGLEPILPDGKVGGFGRDMVPLLRQGDYNGTISQMVSQIAGVIAEDSHVSLDTLSQMPAASTPEGHTQEIHLTPRQILVLLILLFTVGPLLLRFLGPLFLLSILSGGMGRGRSGGWGGGGFGGGGGGFGGFGGGSSGGGGAGGGW